jgi:Transposase DDE domain
MSGIAPETLAVAAYVAFLVIAAGLLDVAARHAHARSDRWRIAGFSYDHRLDTWRCTQGEHLHRVDTDHALRLARYRARAERCNACPVKPQCTDSDTGREVTRPLDPWPRSEAGRFHRAICLVLLVLAAVLLAVELARHHAPVELGLGGVLLAIVLAIAARAAASFRATPAGLPGSRVARPVDP